ncbi:ATP-binding protein [Chamaesiphon sp. VAR_48_metabat_403]|uniref:hybrid sensor histidine kinase/response regulator n=1 Tax=Chamaesiphon sp. VAR_48_metabat_403 TaxID=2964700 RepID=UPI00286E6001|nr:ATP-binding protein [Chamaesiphon sp. VAR_48_metabat_403]
MEIRSPSAVVSGAPVFSRVEELYELCGERSLLLDLVTDAIVLWSIDGQVKYWNRSAERMYGWLAASAIGKQIVEFLYHLEDPHYQAAIAQTLECGEWNGELQLLTREGKSIAVASHWYLFAADNGTPQSILTIDSDITQHKLLERQFLHAQRLENLGALASGIAHDLNNILTPIVAITELLPLKLKNLDERTQKLLNTLSENSKRGRELVAQILSFARGGDGEHTLLQPRHLLAEVMQIARQTFPRSIEVSLHIENTHLWTLSADANQLHQVLINLCINARDAMPTGGELTLRAENIIISSEYTKLHPHAHSGAYVAITVADTGIGIEPESIDLIFEPFFTTKEIGKGTGLGLSIVRTIVKNHHGFIDVSSQVDRGTQFRLYLPATPPSEGFPHAQIAAKCDLSHIPLAGKNELILIVDDEPSIREILSTTIESYQYRTISASNSQQAIDLYTQHHGEIRAILLDYMMPGGNPSDTIARFHSIDPNVRAIVMSGLSAGEIEAHTQSETIKAFLAKPFSTQDLLHTLRTVLN